MGLLSGIGRLSKHIYRNKRTYYRKARWAYIQGKNYYQGKPVHRWGMVKPTYRKRYYRS